MDTRTTSLWALGEPALVDLNVGGEGMAPSIGHKTDLEHRDLQTMLKSCKTAHLPLDSSPQSPAFPMTSVDFSKHGPIICWKEQMCISRAWHLAATVDINSN